MASGVAAAGAAVAFYFYSRRVKMCGFGGRSVEDSEPENMGSHFEGAYQAPSTWMEALFFFAEALRYMYNESLGRWRTADLLIGLAYLARQESANMAVADIAAAGRLVGQGKGEEERQCIVEEFKRMAHFMKYCQALRERQLPVQTRVLSGLGIKQHDILLQQAFAGMLKPSYVLVRDHKARCIVLAIRGTHSIKDLFTSLTSASKPHHMLSESGLVLGYSHFGMLAAARWVMQQTQATLREALEGCPGYHLQIVGHSLGAGTAALLTTRLREIGGIFAAATCLAIACPAVMTLDLAKSCDSYVTTLINGHDMIPTLSPGAADALREEVMESAWYEAFRADMRSSVVVRAVEASVGSVTSVASSWTSAGLSSATRSFRACYSRRGQAADLKRSSSDQDLIPAAVVREGEGGEHAQAQRGASTAREAATGESFGSVEVAREWANPQAPESPSWERVLEGLEPFEAGRQQDEGSCPEGLGSASNLRASWPASAASGGRPLPPKQVLRKPGFWGRLWPQSCRADPDEAALAFSQPPENQEDSNFDSIHSPPPMDGMSMARTRIERLQQDSTPEAEAPDGFYSPPVSPVAARADGGDAGVGGVGLQRRMTYPAGRIYHLVPARLVFGEEAARSYQQQREAAKRNEEGEGQAAGGSAGGEQGADGRTGGDASAATPPQPDSPGVFYEGVAAHQHPRRGDDPYVVVTTNSMKAQRGVAPPIPPMEEFVLLEDVPQEVYGRIRLCSRMLADHFIPSYLGSLQSALALVSADYALPDAGLE